MLNHPKFPSWPCYSKAEGLLIKNVLLSNKVNYWTGSETKAFELEFGNWLKVKYAIALANGTLALDVALKAIGVGIGDDVIVTPRTFIASVSCIVNCGARPIFADVDRNSGNITAKTISKVLTPQTKAIICVHLSGWPCDMDPIMQLAEKFKIKVIEDCAQAHGAIYKNQKVGSIGHIGAWSFCQDKIMTTGGEGGMVSTNDKDLWQKMWAYKDHGKSYEAIYERQHPKGFRWVHESFGTNYRMLEMQAVLGRYQLKKMKLWKSIRQQNANILLKALKSFDSIRVPEFKCNTACDNDCYKQSHCQHAYYKCYAYIENEFLKVNWSRDRIIEELNIEGIPCFQGGCSEVYLEKAFDRSDFKPKFRLKVAKELGESSLMFLVHPTLTIENMTEVVKAIKEVLHKATK